MRLDRLLPFGVALVATAAPLAAWAATGTTVQSGWWNETSVGALAAPSSNPSNQTGANQLKVSNGLSGPLAFSAVRIAVPSGTPLTSQITLTLAAPSGSTIGTASVSACPTEGSWKAGADQAASAAPKYSCQSGHQADGRPATNAETWSFPLSWGNAGTVSVALIPTPGSAQPFSVTYTAPTAASVTVGPPAAESPAPAPAGSGSPAGQPAPAGGQPVGGGGSTGSAVGTSGPQGGAVAATAPGAAAAPGGSTASPALGVLPAVAPAGPGSPAASPAAAEGNASDLPRPPVAASGATAGTHGSSFPTSGRVMAFCLLVVTGLALFFLAARPERAPRLLGPLAARVGRPTGAATTLVGGIGRFARERTAPPKRI